MIFQRNSSHDRQTKAKQLRLIISLVLKLIIVSSKSGFAVQRPLNSVVDERLRLEVGLHDER